MGPQARSVVLLASCIAGAAALLAQATKGGGGSSAPPPQTAPGRVSPTLASPTTTGTTAAGANTGTAVSLLTGQVMMDDGAPPPETVTIEIACKGAARPYGHTNFAGSFSIDLNTPDATSLADASTRAPVKMTSDSALNPSATRGSQTVDLFGCELRARLPGFTSPALPLSGRRRMDDPDVGTILLHRVAGVNGYSFSMTTENAPPDASKAYSKGLDLAHGKKWPDSEHQLRHAVGLYPKYAVAWETLGRVLVMQQRIDESRYAFSQAIEADGKYVTPHLQLMLVSGVEARWEDVLRYSAEVIHLDPYSYPLAYSIGARVNLALGRRAEAEQLARKGLSVDEQRGTAPELKLLLGNLLAERGAYAEALPYLRAYLETLEEGEAAARLKRAIERVEQSAARVSPAAAQPDRN